jgi:hypothetical protein
MAGPDRLRHAVAGSLESVEGGLDVFDLEHDLDAGSPCAREPSAAEAGTLANRRQLGDRAEPEDGVAEDEAHVVRLAADYAEPGARS